MTAGTKLALQWIVVKGFRLYSFQLPGTNGTTPKPTSSTSPLTVASARHAGKLKPTVSYPLQTRTASLDPVFAHDPVVLRSPRAEVQTHRSYLTTDDQSRATPLLADELVPATPDLNPEPQKVR